MFKLKIFICDYIDPATETTESLIVEAEDINDAEKKVIVELKALSIPKRYIINMEELWLR